ncbi:MAG: sulfatase [Treponema sp.]|nr:sulfatase [Treponema sp.]
MERPNLIYIFADQLRYQSVGYAGDSKAQTPNIDRLRNESLDLFNAVSGHPVCAPYRASLFTGKYTTSTGMVINEIRLNPSHHPRCFAHILNENGYDSAYIGKWHLYAAQFGNHLDPRNSFIPPGPDRLGFNGYFAAYNFHHNYYGSAAYYHLDSPGKIYCEAYEPDTQTNMAIEQLERLGRKNKPFGLFLSLGTPHLPWTPENVPGKYMERFKDTEFTLPENYLPKNDPYADRWAQLNEKERNDLTSWMKIYYAMTANLDDNIGRLMAAIKNLGLEDNSIIIFTSDHGELFGAHGRHAKNIFYDEAVRVPFLLKWKGRFTANSSRDICLNTVDIMPTLLSMMELPVPEAVEGKDLKDALFGKPGAFEPEGALMMGTGATAIFEDGHEWRAYRTKRYTYAVYRVDNRELLFDNQVDPLQMKDLAGDPAYAGIKASLRDKMRFKMAEINDTFECCTWYEKNWVRDRLIKRTALMDCIRITGSASCSE